MNLDPLPDGFEATRDALHQIAFFAMAPARYQAEGRMGLQPAPGGFGTPRFGDRVLRAEGNTLISEQTDQVASQTITTIRSAAGFFGVDYEVDWFPRFHDPPLPVDPDAPLEVDDAVARALGHWFDYGTEVLGRLASHAVPEDDASPVTLWPEHFDPAMEMGRADDGRRASYGASPGDGAHHQPYLYVSAWEAVDRSQAYWNDPSFSGASMGFAELAAADDPIEAGVAFLLDGYRILHSA